MRQPASQQKVQQCNRKIERNDHGQFVDAAGEDISGQDLLEMFGALRRPIDQQDRSRRGNDVDNSDQCFLRNPLRPHSRERKQQRRHKRERQRVAIGCEALRGVPEHERHGSA